LIVEHSQRRPQLKNSVLWQLVGLCLDADPIARPSAMEAFAFVRDFDWRDLPGCDSACVKSFLSSLDSPQTVDIASLVPEGRDLELLLFRTLAAPFISFHPFPQCEQEKLVF
jgi:hypothetical protein